MHVCVYICVCVYTYACVFVCYTTHSGIMIVSITVE